MNSIRTVYNTLRERGADFHGEFYIPEKWNHAGFPDYTRSAERPGEIRVNPYRFYADTIEKCFLRAGGSPASVPQKPLTQSAVYGMMPRFYAAWPNGADGKTRPGTFLRCMALLPLVRRLGADILYLLPVFQVGEKYRKGDLGSVYSIRDIYRLDDHLHDPLLDGMDVRVEFRAFVEACHALGMRVMLDFVFRTVARDSKLIYDHPDWFYWIRADREPEFHPPVLPGSGAGKPVGETLARLYRTAEESGYFNFFAPPPNKTDPAGWEKIRAARGRGGDAFAALRNGFGITTAPGFSDVVNDRQPPWTDVTYLRFYRDGDTRAEKGGVPYILQDGASLNDFPGRGKNRELWDYTVGVIPFYEREYGIDGARIDMAHALPAELCDAIIAAARRVNPDFVLWSEELNPEKGGQARRSGFDVISGFTYMNYKEFQAPDFNERLMRTLNRSPLPLTAALETPDTPRAALVCRDGRFLRMLAVVNCFLPNTLPLITNGQELAEIQPMNLGLDNSERGRYVLPPDDPAYGKLAFFDTSRLHWLRAGGPEETIRIALALRERFAGLVGDPSRFVWESAVTAEKNLTFLCYRDAGFCVFCAANRGERVLSLFPGDLLPDPGASSARILYRNGPCPAEWTADRPLVLEAGGIAVGSADLREDAPGGT